MVLVASYHSLKQHFQEWPISGDDRLRKIHGGDESRFGFGNDPKIALGKIVADVDRHWSVLHFDPHVGEKFRYFACLGRDSVGLAEQRPEHPGCCPQVGLQRWAVVKQL